ncbi:MAG: mechanosensitive ion channel [Chloroflexota bacterium]|nr:mechanosensitive ion channel [Chloroflexota bacterium]
MWWEELRASEYFGAAVGGAVFVAALALAPLVALLMRRAANRFDQGTIYGVGGPVLRALRTPLALFIVVSAAFIGAQFAGQLDRWDAEIKQAYAIALIVLGARALSLSARAAIDWYMATLAHRTETTFDDQMLPLVRRVLRVVVYGVAALLVMDLLGYSPGLLLGGLGITGLAIALALQPTLSNFFAGTYVISDQAIRPGDYIELQGGPSGYVVNVGWRTTKIRTWLNTLVIIPNAVMADTVITNYQGPEPALNVMVTCGVSYSSDLQLVQEAALDVCRQVVATNPEAVSEMEPWFGFDSFGDSNVNFWVFLQARDRISSFIVTNDLIKRLHARFAEEGIEINYPVRKLVLPEGVEGLGRRGAAADESSERGEGSVG